MSVTSISSQKDSVTWERLAASSLTSWKRVATDQSLTDWVASKPFYSFEVELVRIRDLRDGLVEAEEVR